MRRITIILTLSLFPVIVCEAQKNITHNNQQWLQYYNQLKLSESLTLFSDASLRRIDNFNHWQQLALRTGIGYQLFENLNGVTGFGCFESFNYNKPSKIEFRPYQELNTSQEFGKISVQHRFRAEGRYFRTIPDGEITSNFNFRFRYRLFFKTAILKLSKTIPERKLFLNFGDELFINAGKEITYNMLDNNRMLFGLSFQVNKNLDFSFTYNYQLGQRNKPSTYEHSDVFWIGITHKIAFTHNNKTN